MGMSRLIFLFTVAFHRIKTAKKIYQNGKKWSYLKKTIETKKIHQTNKFVKANTRYIQCFFVCLNLVNVICRFVSAKKNPATFLDARAFIPICTISKHECVVPLDGLATKHKIPCDNMAWATVCSVKCEEVWKTFLS